MSDQKKLPVMSFGPFTTDQMTSIEVAIWQNEFEGDSGKFTTYNITMKRSYRDKQGKWHPNLNYRPHDIPVMIHALEKAYAWILDAKAPTPE